MRHALCGFVFAVAASVAPAFAGPLPPAEGPVSPTDDGISLVIDSGRLVVMMDQAKAALALLKPNGTHADLAPAAERAYAFQELVAAVLHYNLLQQQACRAGLAAPVHCTGPYLPDWLKDPPGTDHSEAALRAMVEDASRHMVPFWGDLCAKGRAAAKDAHFCDLE